ncbi:toxin-antitoxin system YwqK family antitoxin [Spongiimicrobium sp. 2-473A-2-J]|uniref:toxin-antitoxin system YwqK family antitoxin n=1 Tax=Eudoraea algarum TaxID=3417568 RepID=UPI003D35E661
MKTFAILALGLLSIGLNAQNIAPQFQKEGDNIRATYFHENGNVAQTGYFLNGKLHGKWKMYNAEGKKIAMGKYIQGKRTGKWLFWQGDILKEVNYTDSKIAAVVTKEKAKRVVVN